MEISIIAEKNVDDKNIPVLPTWAKWNPEILKKPQNNKLSTPLSKKKILRPHLGKVLKSILLKK